MKTHPALWSLNHVLDNGFSLSSTSLETVLSTITGTIARSSSLDWRLPWSLATVWSTSQSTYKQATNLYVQKCQRSQHRRFPHKFLQRWQPMPAMIDSQHEHIAPVPATSCHLVYEFLDREHWALPAFQLISQPSLMSNVMTSILWWAESPKLSAYLHSTFLSRHCACSNPRNLRYSNKFLYH